MGQEQSLKISQTGNGGCLVVLGSEAFEHQVQITRERTADAVASFSFVPRSATVEYAISLQAS